MNLLLLLACVRSSGETTQPLPVDRADDATDVDGDGYEASVDCDDHATAVHPGATEVCANAADDDCDGRTDAEAEGCAWEGDWDVGSADVTMEMADGGAGSSLKEWAVLGSILAVPDGLHDLELYDLSARAANLVGRTDTPSGLSGVSLIRMLNAEGDAGRALTIATESDRSAVVGLGDLTDGNAFAPTAQLGFELGDSTCMYVGLDATALWTAGDPQATRVAIPCTNSGWPSPEAPPSYVYVFSTDRIGDFTLADADLTIAGSYWQLGSEVTASDLDADGVDDLIVGEQDWVADINDYDQYSANVGAVFVFDGDRAGSITDADYDGAILGVRKGYIGQSAAAVGDVDDDGYPDLAVGDGHGAYLFRGPILETQTVDDAWASWLPAVDDLGTMPGYTLAPPGDVDGDGRPDLLVGAPWTATGDGTWLLYDLDAGEHTLEVSESVGFFSDSGFCFAPGTDLDHDGRSDFILGRTGPSGDQVSVFYGRER